jgi:hypothetical protein
MTRYLKGTIRLFTCLLLGVTGLLSVGQAQSGYGRNQDPWGPNFHSNRDVERRHRERPRRRPPTRPLTAMAMAHHWNHTAVDMAGLDHMRPGPTDTWVFGQQLGPGRSALAMAIVHTAIFDAVNAIAGNYDGYTDLPSAPRGASMEAAIALASHDTLNALYPSQSPETDQTLAEDLAVIPNGLAKTQGMRLGRSAAARILALRAHDRSDIPDPLVVDFITSHEPGQWQQDPISMIPIALGAYWGRVKPLVIPSARRFRAPPPPDLGSDEYAEAYNEVKRLGGDGIITPTERTEDQTIAATYWAYDGTPSLCAPPRMYNQIVVQLFDQSGSTNVVEFTRLLALVNIAMADAGIASWETKFHYNLWRPITAIRESDSGPWGPGDGNELTEGDPNFTPLGAPASNIGGPDFTPPFPGYTSGHATFGGAVFQVLRRYFGTDRIPFTFVSDEYNGVTVDSQGVVRPLIPRTFQTLSQAEEENGQSRIYLGIHFAFDKTDGIAQGRRVGDYVFANVLRRSRR